MKKIALLLLIATAAIQQGCECEHDPEPNMPECITAQIWQDKSGIIKTISVQTVNGQRHYWINTDAQNSDGIEYIVDENCTQVCYICGECAAPDCLNNYTYTDWVTIWQR
ncbi:MAG: hypothetical protein KA974_06150 [Saprospiraceae bacterium]|nr:hypothetical protein [Saprospiraceae bacterium]MBP7680224.1 hypothetical protein [Saprospiraceae bacterium]